MHKHSIGGQRRAKFIGWVGPACRRQHRAPLETDYMSLDERIGSHFTSASDKRDYSQNAVPLRSHHFTALNYPSCRTQDEVQEEKNSWRRNAKLLRLEVFHSCCWLTATTKPGAGIKV
ncbi:hypothetical protein NQZ68_012105 [Dissostichus eleginoides]|nr:hypothetical protein NQZ68_012105 [Dissostichus eleginoides]